MGQKTVGLIVGIAVAVAIAVAAFMVLERHKTVDDASLRQTDQVVPGEPAPDAVTIANMAFAPKTLMVKKGTTVTWTNKDTLQHSITSDTGITGGPNSQLLGRGDAYTFTFATLGTYTYHCQAHPGMKATVVVTE